MLGLILAIVVSGLLMGNGEVFEEGHGLLAYVYLAIVAVHVVGVFRVTCMSCLVVMTGVGGLPEHTA